MKKNGIRYLLIGITIIYFIVVIGILLFRNRYSPGSSLLYWDSIKRNIQLIPFYTISEMFSLMSNQMVSYSARFLAMLNLLGNLLILFPAGLFLPAIFEKLRSFKAYIFCIFLFIFIVEILQLFTLAGAFDIDDILLNSIGAILGFTVFKGLRRLYRNA